MKTGILVVLGLMLTNFAQAGRGPLEAVISKVQQCAVLPFTIKDNGQLSYHAMFSQCDEVQIVAPGVATIDLNGHGYVAALTETVDSDEDFYDVDVKDLLSGKIYHIDHVIAYGDVLLGMLSGDTRSVLKTHVQDKADLDSTIIHSRF